MLSNFTLESSQAFVIDIKFLLAEKPFEDFAYGAYTTFPHASELRAIWRSEDPFDAFLQKTFVDLAMIP